MSVIIYRVSICFACESIQRHFTVIRIVMRLSTRRNNARMRARLKIIQRDVYLAHGNCRIDIRTMPFPPCAETRCYCPIPIPIGIGSDKSVELVTRHPILIGLPSSLFQGKRDLFQYPFFLFNQKSSFFSCNV